MSAEVEEFWRGRTVVYRCYDADGSLLYVGCTSNWPARLRMHAVSPDSTWWSYQTKRVVIRLAPSVAVGLEVERAAIRTEKPRCNILGRGPRASWAETDYLDVIAALSSRTGSSLKRRETVEVLRLEVRRRFAESAQQVAS